MSSVDGYNDCFLVKDPGAPFSIATVIGYLLPPELTFFLLSAGVAFILNIAIWGILGKIEDDKFLGTLYF